MEGTPNKKSSLSFTPKRNSERTVRFSAKEALQEILGTQSLVNEPGDTSVSDIEDTSTDEEWVISKSRYMERVRKDDGRTPAKPSPLKEVVSPLKLLRKPEYEVNKLSTHKKSESAVSPIVIKRKTDSKKNSTVDPSVQPLTTSSKINTEHCPKSPKRTVSPKKLQLNHRVNEDSDIENEVSPKKIYPVNKINGERQNEAKVENELDKSFEDKITNLRIADTPKKDEDSKSKRRGTRKSVPAQPSLRESSASLKNQPQEDEKMDYEHSHPIKTPSKKKLDETDSEDCFVSPPKRRNEGSPCVGLRRSNRKSVSRKKTTIITNSDFESPSPPLRLTRSKRSQVFLNPNSPKSAKKSLAFNVEKSPEDSTKRFASPEVNTPKNSTEKEKTPAKTRSTRRSVAQVKSYKDDSDMELSSPEIKKTPLRNSAVRESVKDSPDLRRQVLTPRVSVRKKLELSSPASCAKKVGTGFLSPVVPERARRSLLGTPHSLVEETRASLHTCNIPTSLPCREKEFENISKFLLRKIEDKAGGCMYISGVPGTGKTASVHAVIKSLQNKAVARDVPKFDFVEINALRLTEPRQAYTRIWQELCGEKKSPDQAMKCLEKKFNGSNKRPCVILIDELDYLCNRRQDVIYNILEWSTKSSAALTVITIANTMDLPERTLKGKVTSRMGLTRLVFQPYTFQQLQQIVMNRIGDKSNFHVDAVQLVARKVAAVSGDARRALDICRRVTETIKSDTDIIKVSDIEKVITQIFTGTRVQAIKKCSPMCQYVLRAMRDEFQRTGVEESTVGQIYSQLTSICAFEGCEAPPVGLVLSLCTILSNSGLILAEKSRSDLNRKISLNVSADDIFYACGA